MYQCHPVVIQRNHHVEAVKPLLEAHWVVAALAPNVELSSLGTEVREPLLLGEGGGSTMR